MCGITGYVGGRNATEILLEGLRKLEYRGYDSAGIAVLAKGEVRIVRAEGKLKNLDEKLRQEPVNGTIGIGHTRWATHGRPSEINAHPHRAGPVILVHNGIIENHEELRTYLADRGHTMQSETDTELVAHLISQNMTDGQPMKEAFVSTLKKLMGTYALVVMNGKEPDRLYIARKGSPIVVGLGQGENFVASDIPALLPYTRKVLFLEYGDFGVLTRDGLSLWDKGGRPVKREVKKVDWSQTMAEKEGFKHFMIKEIFEQPRAVADTLTGRVLESQRVSLNGAESLFGDGGVFPFESIDIVACGTSYHAGLVGRYLIEEFARVSVNVDLASEYRYRSPVLGPKKLILAISQSGETADTLAAITEAREKGAKVLSICNVTESSIPRASDRTLYTRAGPEIGVASTKAFTTQIAALLLIAVAVGERRKTLSKTQVREILDQVVRVPDLMAAVLKKHLSIEKVAKQTMNFRSFLYIARGISHPIALEGALKLKEISYIHAEGYAAGEMKHGPIALIDDTMPVVVVAPKDASYEKILSNLEEAKARGARLIGVGTEGDEKLKEKCLEFLSVPAVPWYTSPLLTVIPLQLLAYYVADHKGTDVDQPRNLAKSVTVE